MWRSATLQFRAWVIGIPAGVRVVDLGCGTAAPARDLLAWCYESCFVRGGFDDAEKTAALRHARKAAASGTDDATALAISGFVLTLLSKKSEAGLSAIDLALALNTSCATALHLGPSGRSIHVG
jgi:hypothetical protein